MFIFKNWNFKFLKEKHLKIDQNFMNYELVFFSSEFSLWNLIDPTIYLE